ncbi:4-coumarate- ligase [Moniliophthora roreri MCA 2997]|uniref:4-coumarate-ligase n=1 Tax=Moniliophthora roreri (strain MCA 2997) TaxID=1381753 RepID=V2XPD6_MONRO|nr:4-coumarate- ligase [Moniliophthora roreri MCA 2997]
MYLKSPYPDPPPVVDLNAHYAFFHRPEQAQWSDFTFQIDAATDKKRTYKEFVGRVKAGATALSTPVADGGLGLSSEGEMVGIMSENSVDYSVVVHSLIAIATPFALISAYSTRLELLHAFSLAKLTRLFVQPKYLQAALSAAKEVKLPLKNIYVMNGNLKGYRSFGNMIERVEKANIPLMPPRPATKDTLAYLVFSSGTSGLPKAVMITHGNLLYSLYQTGVVTRTTMEVYTPPTPKTPEGIPIALGFLPMHHSYGLHAYCFRSLLSPTTIVILAKWNIDVALKVIPKYRVSTLNLIPSVIHQLVNHPKLKSADLSSVSNTFSGAAYLPPELAAKFISYTGKEATLTEGYGLSECTIAALTQPFPGIFGGKAKRVIGSAGVPLPGMEARILRDDGSNAEVNEAGDLWLKGGNVSPGYYNNDAATKEAFDDGWLKTGDKFRVDQDGYFFFADRTKDTLKVSGTQVSPVEIEDVLLAQPDKLITDITVAGVQGHGRTSDEKVPRAWIVLSEDGKKRGAPAVIKVLEEWQQENLSKFKWLRGGIEVVKEIPKSPTGKVLRRVLVERYEQRTRKLRGKL